MEHSEKIDELAGALAAAQSSFAPAARDGKNPFFESTYSTLASVWAVCRESLALFHLAIVQSPEFEDGGVVRVETMLMHESGQWVKSTLRMVSKDNSPQAIGQCITYARRYALMAVLGIAPADDDDGNLPTHGTAAVQAKAPPAKPVETIGKEGQEQLAQFLQGIGKTWANLRTRMRASEHLNSLADADPDTWPKSAVPQIEALLDKMATSSKKATGHVPLTQDDIPF